MFLSKVLHKPNWVGVIMITLLFGAGFIYAFAFDGFNIEKVTGSEVEVWLALASGGGSGEDPDPDPDPCDCQKNHCTCVNKNRISGNNPCGGQTFKWPCPSDTSECRRAHHPKCPCRDKGDVIDVCSKNKKKKKDKCNGKNCRNKKKK